MTGRALASFRLALGIALAGALWAAFSTWTCEACKGSGLATASLGVVLYALLLSASFPERTRFFAEGGAVLAFSAHLCLLAPLLAGRHFCAPCTLAASGAFLATLAVFVGEPRARAKGAACLALAGVVAGFVYARSLPIRDSSGGSGFLSGVSAVRSEGTLEAPQTRR